MAKYLISFDKGAMDHIPEEDFPEVGRAGHAVCREAKEAGVFVYSGGLDYDAEDPKYAVEPAVVGVDGVVTDGPYPESKELIGGVFIVEVPTREEALEWAAKVAAACRCAQDVRKFMYDPDEV
ncbi:YciI family protein [Kribbella sp. NPDC051770]|uniref:YciI family protein n=1 Tax=Kribbella sp. NPDC051770 TaxID=3155413 RepID=UPI003434CD01